MTAFDIRCRDLRYEDARRAAGDAQWCLAMARHDATAAGWV